MKLPEFKDLPRRNQEALKNKKNLTNLEKACYLLGWQGGTIHQVAEATGLNVDQILKADDIETLMKTQMKKAGLTCISSNLRVLANVLDPDIKNPLPEIRKKAEELYQELISTQEGKAIYADADKAFPDSLPNKVESILSSLRNDVMQASGKDSNKFQILNAYLRDKISDGLQ